MLSAKAFYLGYVQKEHMGEKQVTLYMEHSVFHIRGYDFQNRCRLFWETVPTLKEAKKIYGKMKTLHLGRGVQVQG